MPSDPTKRARATTWMFAALNSIEPHIQNLTEIDLFHADTEWARQRRPMVETAVKARLASLSAWLEGREHLEDRFTAGDLLMTTVLRILRPTDIVSQVPVFETYCLRCEGRPAFKKAMTDHMANSPNIPPQRLES